MDSNRWLTNQGIDPDVLPDKEWVREVYEHAQLRGEAYSLSSSSSARMNSGISTVVMYRLRKRT